jgi:hypothetical protein
LQPTLELVAPVADFALSLSPDEQTVPAGTNTTITVTITGTNNFDGNVTLSVDDLPSGITADFSPASVSGSGSATLTLSVAADVEPDIYIIPIAPASGDLKHDGTITLTVVFGDVDGDGIPDWWTQQYFGHSDGRAGDLSRATDDRDGDGMSNLKEYLSGTDPTDPADYLHLLNLSAQSGDETISWAAIGGISYIVQSSTNLAAGFSDTSPVITPDNNGTATYTDAGAATNSTVRFYRVRLAR